MQKSLGLAEWQVKQKTERQGSFDGDVGVSQLRFVRSDGL